MLRAVERVLGGAHRVIGSQSSAQAVAIAAEFNPELVILDVRMPEELDGFELMARLKADHPEVEIILMTGSIDDLDQKLIRAIRGRAFYFIQKPFSPPTRAVCATSTPDIRQGCSGTETAGSSG